MSLLESVRAQETAVQALLRAREQGRVASAYLFDGPSGVGKELAAVSFATDLVAGDDPHIVDRIEAGAHPDVRVFRPRDEGKRNIQVEVLRSEILPLAQFAPFEASATFFIFPEADISFPEFQPEAANALLKTLEEPRPNVHFILTSERPDSLLSTIRSRCQRIRFARLPTAVLREILEAEGVPEEAIGPAITLSAGRADVALALASDGAVEELTELTRSVDEAVRAAGPGALVELAEQLARRDDLELALLTLQSFYRDLSVSSLDADAGLASAAAARVSLIHECVQSMRHNANRQVALDSLLFDLRNLR
ncbi:MAG: AAA family ATPase [Myxococcales bacterium]|nr:MAG: AAA family ATPase [Myxococcales bacterium]